MKSEIQIIGEALFGASWMTQVAGCLKNESGEFISRQTVQTWHNRDRLPLWAKADLVEIIKKRFNEIENLKISMIDNYYLAYKRIKDFLLSDDCKNLKVGDVIYCRSLLTYDKYRNEMYDAEITLEEKPNVDGWKKIEIDSIDVSRGLKNLEKELIHKIVYIGDYFHDAQHDLDIHFTQSRKLDSWFK